MPTYSLYYVEGDTHRDPSAEALEEAPMLPRNWRDAVRREEGLPLVAIKTHDFPQDDAPAIFIARDGRAAIHSYFHYHKKFAFEQPSLTEVIAGACQFGNWSDHYWAWRPKTRANTLLLLYDELVSKPESVIPRLTDFLKRPAQKANLPEFEDLQRRRPAFFRRGQNTDYLSEWTAGQLALFNVLHGDAMRDLGMETGLPSELSAAAVEEVARSASRLHRLYLEQLTKLGRSANLHHEEVLRLTAELRTASARIDEELNPLLNSPWVRLGRVIGAVQQKPKRVKTLDPIRAKPATPPESGTVTASGGNS